MCAIDSVWIPLLAAKLQPLDGLFTEDVKADLFPALVQEAQVDGRFIGMPAWTNTEVLLYRVPSFERIAYVSLPMFNDVHHVRPTPNGNLLVANTGLDMVLEMTREGAIVQVWNVLGDDPWERFSEATDYRKVKSTKPHLAHPNHVFYVGDEPWASRFQQKDAISLVDPTATNRPPVTANASAVGRTASTV